MPSVFGDGTGAIMVRPLIIILLYSVEKIIIILKLEQHFRYVKRLIRVILKPFIT